MTGAASLDGTTRCEEVIGGAGLSMAAWMRSLRRKMARLIGPFVRRLGRVLAASALLGATAARADVVQGLSARSPALGRPIPYALYRPPPGRMESGERLPVLYLLHGLGDDERAWATLGRAGETLDRLIFERRIKPLLVVMPAAGRSWYVDNPDPGGAGMMAQALTQDLVAHVEATEPALPCREGRAVGGLSMGGYGALLYAMSRPRLFAAAFSLSGSLFRPMPDEAAERARRSVAMLNTAFGDPFDWRRFNAWNLFPKVPAYAADPDRTPFYLAVGSEDFPGLIAGGRDLHRALAEAGIEAPFRTDPGGHAWPLWAAQLGPALAWVDARLSARCGP